MRAVAKKDRQCWEDEKKLADLIEADWKKATRAALSEGQDAPPLPEEARLRPEPHMPRLIVNDGSVAKTGVLMAEQPKGFLLMRDELSGWLLGMEELSNGSDRAFWLEAFGGRDYSVERISRSPLTIDRLSIGVTGGIQPDRLSDLLLKGSDDGLLARFLPIWPKGIDIRQPENFPSDKLADQVVERLLGLQMIGQEDDSLAPQIVHFDEGAQSQMNEWRKRCAEWENNAEGLLLSFIGKLSGLAARISLVLSAIDFAFDHKSDPAHRMITEAEFGRACHFLESYAMPMARRTYSIASGPKSERGARRLIALIREMQWQSFHTREVRRMERRGLETMDKINAALKVVETGDLIRAIGTSPGPQGGRPQRLFAVNPVVHEAKP